MSYDVTVTLASALPAARVTAAVLALPGLRENGKALCWCHDAYAADGQRFFTIEVQERSWLGRVKGLAMNLPYGGSFEEARAFAEAVQRLVVALEGRAFDPQWGRDLPVAGEAEAVLTKWIEANAATLAGYGDDGGWHVRPRTVVAEDGRTLLPEAVRADPADPATGASIARAIERMRPPAEPARGPRPDARADAERLIARLGAPVPDQDEDEDVPSHEDLIDALVDLGAPAAERLAVALAGPESHLVYDALARLGAAAAPALVEALAGDGRHDAADLLRALGPAARAPLVAALPAATGTAAGEITALLASPALQPDLAAATAVVERALRWPDEDSTDAGRVLAAAAARGHDVTPLAARLLREASSVNALEALGPLARAGARPLLEPLLEHLLASDEADADDVGELLAAVDRAAAAARLEEALDRPGAPARLLVALRAVDGVRALPRLVERVRRDDEDDGGADDAFEAAYALGSLRDLAALPALLALLDDPCAAVRRAVACSLGLHAAPDARAALERLAREDPAPEVRAEAERALRPPGSAAS